MGGSEDCQAHIIESLVWPMLEGFYPMFKWLVDNLRSGIVTLKDRPEARRYEGMT